MEPQEKSFNILLCMILFFVIVGAWTMCDLHTKYQKLNNALDDIPKTTATVLLNEGTIKNTHITLTYPHSYRSATFSCPEHSFVIVRSWESGQSQFITVGNQINFKDMLSSSVELYCSNTAI